MFYENPIKLWPSVSHFHLCRALSQLSCSMPSSYSSLIHSVRLQLTVSFCLLVWGGGERRQNPSCLYIRSAGYQKQVSLGSGKEFASMPQISKWELFVVITHTHTECHSQKELTEIKWKHNEKRSAALWCTLEILLSGTALWAAQHGRGLESLQSQVSGEVENVSGVFPFPSFPKTNSFFLVSKQIGICLTWIHFRKP